MSCEITSTLALLIYSNKAGSKSLSLFIKAILSSFSAKDSISSIVLIEGSVSW